MTEFNKWIEEVYCLRDLKIRHRFSDCFTELSSYSLHTFSDVSKRSYAAPMFVRVENKDKASVQLVTAKSRFATLKEIFASNLFVAAIIGTRLHSQVCPLWKYHCGITKLV